MKDDMPFWETALVKRLASSNPPLGGLTQLRVSDTIFVY